MAGTLRSVQKSRWKPNSSRMWKNSGHTAFRILTRKAAAVSNVVVHGPQSNNRNPLITVTNNPLKYIGFLCSIIYIPKLRGIS